MKTHYQGQRLSEGSLQATQFLWFLMDFSLGAWRGSQQVDDDGGKKERRMLLNTSLM